MAKKILSVIAGVIAGTIVIYLVETICSKVFPPPPGVDIVKNTEALKQYINNAPLGAMLLVLLGYALGSFVAGVVSSRISGGMRQPLITGVLLMAAGIVNLFQLSHPLWFAIATLLTYIPFAYLGGTLGMKRENKN